MRLLAFLLAACAFAQSPKFTKAGELTFPADYREWVFLSSGLGMTYGQNAPKPGAAPRFTNVLVNPASYRAFQKTGQWPEGTMFVLEVRASASEGSINKGGHYQGEIVAMEIEVKDSKRYAETWAYFDFPLTNGAPAATAKPFEPGNRCVQCHSRAGKVENTFVQFYPSLIETAKAKGTWKP
jgi:hypothetical protein